MGHGKYSILAQRYSILAQVDNNVRNSLKTANSNDQNLLDEGERAVLNSLIAVNFPDISAYSIEARRIATETQGFVFEINLKPSRSNDRYNLAVFKLAFPSGLDFSGKLTQRKLEFGKGELNQLLHALGLEVVQVFHFDRTTFPINYGSEIKEEPITRTVMAYEKTSARNVLTNLSERLTVQPYIEGQSTTSIIESLVLRMSAKDWIETKIIFSGIEHLAEHELPEYQAMDYSARFSRNLSALREFWFSNNPLNQSDWEKKYLRCFEDVMNDLSVRMASNTRKSKELVNLGFADDHTFLDEKIILEYGLLKYASRDLMTNCSDILLEFKKVKDKTRLLLREASSMDKTEKLNLSLSDLILLSERIGKDPENKLELTKNHIYPVIQEISAEDEGLISRPDLLNLADNLLDFYKTVQNFRTAREKIAPELSGIRFIDRGDRLRWERWTLPVAYARSKMFYLPEDISDKIAVDMLAQRFILRSEKRYRSSIGLLNEAQERDAVQDFIEGINAFIEQSIYTNFRRVYRLIIEGEKKYYLLDSKAKAVVFTFFTPPEARQRDMVRSEVVDQIKDALSKIVTYNRIRTAISKSDYILENIPFMRPENTRKEVLEGVSPRDVDQMTNFYKGIHELIGDLYFSKAKNKSGDFANSTFFGRKTPE